jgi:DNA segregation ATPase FtsK/SpoIIIE, S-DNA-T family
MSITDDQAKVFANLSIKLAALNIRGTLDKVEAGPIVSTYYMTLAADIPIAKILKAEEDLALAVGAPSVLITRLGTQIAIAIPNKTKDTISFDMCLHQLFKEKHKLGIMLGVDTRGKPTSIDLADSPHILIAGSTGAGKSILLAAIISGLSSTKSSREMKLILCDTKQLDLTLFSSLPHVPPDSICDSLDKVRAMLDRMMLIVRQRTEQMKGIARNITEYNQLGNKLPYYVIIIDELADILMQDRARGKGIRGYDKCEDKLQNLLQICRAAGVHIICATQRPSVEIITGDIKANITTRIALRLPSGSDSRTIINEYGAECLLGKGDMLVESPLFDQITRFHGPYVSMDHIANILMNCDSIRESYRIMNLDNTQKTTSPS